MKLLLALLEDGRMLHLLLLSCLSSVYCYVSFPKLIFPRVLPFRVLKPGVNEKIEQIKLEYHQILEDNPQFLKLLQQEEIDFSQFSETGDLENLLQGAHFEDIPEKLEDGQTPLVRVKIMKTILDSQQALREIEEDLRMCMERRNDEEERTREIAFNFEKELIDIRESLEDELNKLV